MKKKPDVRIQQLIDATKKELLPMLNNVFGVNLNYTSNSLKELEEHINEQYPAPHQVMAVTTYIPYGVYLGEMIINNIGGQWSEEEGNRDVMDIHIVVEQDDENKQIIYPFRRVAKFWNDRTDSLFGFYEMIDMVINQDLAEQMLNKEGEWIELSNGTVVRGFKQDPSTLN